MAKSTITKEDAEQRLSRQLKQSHPDSSGVSLFKKDGTHWTCATAGHDVDRAMAAQASEALQDLQQNYEISDASDGAVAIDDLTTGNDK